MKTIKKIDANVLVLEEVLILISSNYYFDNTIKNKLNELINFLEQYLYIDNISNDIIDSQLFNIITYEEKE